MEGPPPGPGGDRSSCPLADSIGDRQIGRKGGKRAYVLTPEPGNRDHPNPSMAARTRVRLIIFDFDGVVADSEHLAMSVLAEGLSGLGLPTTVPGPSEIESYRETAD